MVWCGQGKSIKMDAIWHPVVGVWVIYGYGSVVTSS